MENQSEVMEVAMQVGHILLENGAEISRVEETIDRICRHYGVDCGEAFVLSNGILPRRGGSASSISQRYSTFPSAAPI